MDGFVVLLVVAVAIGLYFLPTIVASSRGKANTGAIAALNILAGWTFVGWVVAMVWAMTHDAQATA
jgi:hypothetical protein